MSFTILRLQTEALKDLFCGLSASSNESDIKFFQAQIDKTLLAIQEEISRLRKEGGY